MDKILIAINTVGFPIIACIFMAHQNQKLSQSIAELSNTMNIINERLSKIEDFELKKERD